MLEMLKTWLDMDLDGVIYGSAFSRTLHKVVPQVPSVQPFLQCHSALLWSHPEGYCTAQEALLSFYPSSQSNVLISLGSEVVRCGSTLAGRWFSVHENV